MLFLFCFLLLSFHRITGTNFISPTSLAEKRWNTLFDFYKLRTQYPQKRCFWHYSGTICSMATGKMIARIEGMEEVVAKVPQHYNKKDTHCSYLSNKIFFYVTPSNQSNLLHRFKLQPISPQRHVQPIKLFKELVMLSPGDSDQKYNAQLWFSPERCFKTQFEIIQGSNKPSREIVGLEPTLFLTQNVHVRQKQQSRRWISFSSRDDAPRSYEAYSIYKDHKVNFINKFQKLFGFPAIKLIYKRQGLGPSWFIPGAMTRTELIGVQYNNYEALPISVRSLISKHTNSSFNEVFKTESFVASDDSFSYYRPWYVKLLTFNRNRVPRKN